MELQYELNGTRRKIKDRHEKIEAERQTFNKTIDKMRQYIAYLIQELAQAHNDSVLFLEVICDWLALGIVLLVSENQRKRISKQN